ncbi:MAG TPA: hypothetical protein VD735_07845 [Candidatus Saccharimonadales bacterium]|nr:hypothetical protein [Candidatus Saccharimonadales bacterium]
MSLKSFEEKFNGLQNNRVHELRTRYGIGEYDKVEPVFIGHSERQGEKNARQLVGILRVIGNEGTSLRVVEADTSDHRGVAVGVREDISHPDTPAGEILVLGAHGKMIDVNIDPEQREDYPHRIGGIALRSVDFSDRSYDFYIDMSLRNFAEEVDTAIAAAQHHRAAESRAVSERLSGANVIPLPVHTGIPGHIQSAA